MDEEYDITYEQIYPEKTNLLEKEKSCMYDCLLRYLCCISI
jgi:hypothetical protein